jgi:hypothetical protein
MPPPPMSAKAAMTKVAIQNVVAQKRSRARPELISGSPERALEQLKNYFIKTSLRVLRKMLSPEFASKV